MRYYDEIIANKEAAEISCGGNRENQLGCFSDYLNLLDIAFSAPIE